MRKYTIRCKYYVETVDGEPVDLMEGFEFFIYYEYLSFVVTEVSTGYQVAWATSREKAIERAKHNLTTHRDFFIKTVAEKVEENKILFSELL